MTETRQTPTPDEVASTLGKYVYSPEDVLLPYQKRWIADTSPLKIAEKSRRTGLTWGEAADAALTASTARTAAGCNHFYVGSNKEMAREFIDACAMWAKAFNRAADEIQEEMLLDEDREILTFVIYFASGFKVQALSSNPKNLRGMQGNVTIDEAGFHERLAEVLKAALALTMWGSKIRLISTHNGAENLFNELIKDSRAGRKDYSIHTLTLADACRDGLYKRICQVTRKVWSQEAEDAWVAGLLKATATEEDAKEEYFCVPKNSAGAYIPRVLLDRAARPEHKVVRFTAPEGWLEWSEAERKQTALTFCEEVLTPLLTALNPARSHAYGQDFARRGDLSIGAFGSVEQDTRRCIRCYVEMKNVTYAQQKEIVFYILARLPRLRGAAFDETGNGGYLAEAVMLRYGSGLVDCISLTEKWYREWMPKYKALYEDGMIEIPRDEDTITDQRHIQVINGVPKIDKTKSEGSDGAQRHGDAAVAGCMFVRATYMEGGVIEFTPLPERHGNAPGKDDDNDDYHEFERGCW